MIAIVAILVASLSRPVSIGTVSVVLKGGKEMEGADVQRLGGEYRLTRADGRVVSVPAELVVRIEITSEESSSDDDDRPTGEQTTPGAEARTPSPAESSLQPQRPPEDVQLASPPAGPEPEEISEGEIDKSNDAPSETERGQRETGVDPTWEPESVFDDEDVLAKNRVVWQRPGVDPTWTPDSDYSDETDVTNKNRVEWKKPIRARAHERLSQPYPEQSASLSGPWRFPRASIVCRFPVGVSTAS